MKTNFHFCRIMSSLTLSSFPHKTPNFPTNYSSYSIPIKITSLRLLPSNCTSALSSSSLISKPNWVRRKKEIFVENDDDERVFVVVNFYRFVFIKDPEDEVNKHLEFLQVLVFCS